MEGNYYYYLAYGLTICSEVPLNYLKEIPPASFDITIRKGKVLPNPPLQETKVYRAGLHARFAQDGPNKIWLNWDPIVQFMAINGNELIVDAVTSDMGLLSLFITSEAIGLLLFQKGYFLLHGSAIQLDGKGTVFLGEPGAGKSTTVAAFANRGVHIMSDDMVCIGFNETGKPYLVPSFSQIKVWENSVTGLQLSTDNLAHVREGANKFSWHDFVTFEENPVPLEQVFVLTRDDENAGLMHEISAIQKPIELLAHFPLPESILKGDVLKDHFEKSIAIATTTSIQKLTRPATFAKLYEFVENLKQSTE